VISCGSDDSLAASTHITIMFSSTRSVGVSLARAAQCVKVKAHLDGHGWPVFNFGFQYR